MTKPRSKLEADLEALFQKRVRLGGGMSLKMVPTVAGWPDRLAVYPGGRVYLVELKADGGDTRAIQRHVHGNLRDRGVEVVVLTGAAEIVNWCAATARPVRGKPGRKPAAVTP